MKSLLLLAITATILRLSTSVNCIQNDNYCDCGDDEWLTSACSMSSINKFVCKDLQTSHEIHLSQVNDGLCDCCDGSDEDPNTNCKNRCDEVGQARRAAELLRNQTLQLGLQKKEMLLAKSHQELTKLRDIMSMFDKLLPEQELKLKYLNSQLAEEVTREISEFEKLKVHLLSEMKAQLEMPRENFINLVASLVIRGKEESVEAILLDCDEKYEYPGSEPDDAEALVLSMPQYSLYDAAVEVNVDGQPAAVQGPAVSPAVIQDMVKALALTRLSNTVLWNVFAGVLARAKRVSVVAAVSGCVDAGLSVATALSVLDKCVDNNNDEASKLVRSAAADALRGEIKEQETKISQLREGSARAARIRDINFGPDDFLSPLHDECFSTTAAEYTYKVCTFKEATQNHIKLGNFDKFTHEPCSSSSSSTATALAPHPTLVTKLHYSAGDICHTSIARIPRSLVVTLECSMETALKNILEPDVCSYTATLLTPMACFPA